MKCVFYALSEE